MSVTLAITAYEESRKPDKLERAMDSALPHSEVTELIVVDDGSSDSYVTEVRFEEWKDKCARVADGSLTATFHRNSQNCGVFGAKLSAIHRSNREWVQSLDSDNWLPPAYFYTVFGQPLNPRRMLSPSWAKPSFDYREMEGRTLTLKNLRDAVGFKHLGCLVNTGNQFFHRQTMLDVVRECSISHNEMREPDYFNRGSAHRSEHDVKWRKVYDSADSFYFNKLWWLAGHSVYVVPDLHYEHEVHPHSSWQAAPKEKEALPAIYFMELFDKARGVTHDYQFRGTTRHQGRHCVVLQSGPYLSYVDASTYQLLGQAAA